MASIIMLQHVHLPPGKPHAAPLPCTQPVLARSHRRQDTSQACSQPSLSLCGHGQPFRPTRPCMRPCRAASDTIQEPPPQQPLSSATQPEDTTETYSSITFTGRETPQEAWAGLKLAAAQQLPISPAAATALQASLSPAAVASLPHDELAALLLSVAANTHQPLSPAWLDGMLQHVHQRITSHLSEDDMSHLGNLLWAVSELGAQPGQEWLQAAAKLFCSGAQAGSVFATDMCTVLCALGAMEYRPDPATTAAVVKEVQFQLKEFLSDFSARDVSRLASGIADLGIAAALPANFTPQLMKAVYTKVRTIEDKAAVDFALTKLESKEKSLHYDPRWTYEELHWLPRRERDKRRIIAETFKRSQWGGFRPGRD